LERKLHIAGELDFAKESELIWNGLATFDRMRMHVNKTNE